MRPRLTAHPNRGSSPSRTVLLYLILGLLLVLFFGLRAFRGLQMANQKGSNDGIVLHGPSSPEVTKHRLALEGENRRHAYAFAQNVVRAELLPGDVLALFPDITQPELEIIRLQPHRYRVRSLVWWRDVSGSVQQRRFETDLQHGPADSRWRLVDTEFLDFPHDKITSTSQEVAR